MATLPCTVLIWFWRRNLGCYGLSRQAFQSPHQSPELGDESQRFVGNLEGRASHLLIVS